MQGVLIYLVLYVQSVLIILKVIYIKVVGRQGSCSVTCHVSTLAHLQHFKDRAARTLLSVARKAEREPSRGLHYKPSISKLKILPCDRITKPIINRPHVWIDKEVW